MAFTESDVELAEASYRRWLTAGMPRSTMVNGRMVTYPSNDEQLAAIAAMRREVFGDDNQATKADLRHTRAGMR